MTRWLFFSSSGHQKRYLGLLRSGAFIPLVLSVCSHGHTAQKVKHRVNRQVMGRMVRDVSPGALLVGCPSDPKFVCFFFTMIKIPIRMCLKPDIER